MLVYQNSTLQQSWPSTGKATDTPVLAAGVSCRRGLWLLRYGDVSAQMLSFMAQNYCRLEATIKAGGRGHPQQCQSRSSLSRGWGYAWCLLKVHNGCGCSLAELQRAAQLWCSWKDLIYYPWFSWAHSACLNFDFSWFCLVHAVPVMSFKKTFSFLMNVYSSNLPDQKGFTFFFL